MTKTLLGAPNSHSELDSESVFMWIIERVFISKYFQTLQNVNLSLSPQDH